MRPPEKSFPIIDDQESAPGIVKSEFVKQAMPLGIVTGAARGYYVRRPILTAHGERHDMIGTQRVNAPEVVNRISDVNELDREQRPEEPVPDNREGAIPTAPAVSLAELDPHSGADGPAILGLGCYMAVLLVARVSAVTEFPLR